MGKSDNADFIRELKLSTEAESVRTYLLAQAIRDFSNAKEFFTDDIVFNDKMYPVTGSEAVAKSLSDYVKNYLTTFRDKAVNEAGSPGQYLAVCEIALRGVEQTIPTADLISLREGKICRVDNCFDIDLFRKLYMK